MLDLERYVKVGGKMVPRTCPEPAGGAAVHSGSGREKPSLPEPGICNVARNPAAMALNSRAAPSSSPTYVSQGRARTGVLAPCPGAKFPGAEELG